MLTRQLFCSRALVTGSILDPPLLAFLLVLFGDGVLKPGVYSLLEFFVSTAGVGVTRVVRGSLTGVRHSCPRLGERIAPVLSITICLDWLARDGDRAGDLMVNLPVSLLGDFPENGDADFRGLERLYVT